MAPMSHGDGEGTLDGDSVPVEASRAPISVVVPSSPRENNNRVSMTTPDEVSGEESRVSRRRSSHFQRVVPGVRRNTVITPDSPSHGAIISKQMSNKSFDRAISRISSFSAQTDDEIR